MSQVLPKYPFDPQFFLGRVIKVTSGVINVLMSDMGKAAPTPRFGIDTGFGVVGEYAFVEAGRFAVFGRIAESELFLGNRSYSAIEGNDPRVSPGISVQLLCTLDLATGEVVRGVNILPTLASAAYGAQPELVDWVSRSKSIVSGPIDQTAVLEFCNVPTAGNLGLKLAPSAVFGRHCAIFGTTGGGKSWTIARLIQEISRYRSKTILLDASGEFRNTTYSCKHLYIGNDPNPNKGSEAVAFPYWHLTESDLFAILKPSPGAQMPKLRAAIESLKLAHVEPNLAEDGVIHKSETRKKPFLDALGEHLQEIQAPDAKFDVRVLERQIREECVWPSGGTGYAPDPTKWGKYNENDYSYCVSLVHRIQDTLRNRELTDIFSPEEKLPLTDAIDRFFAEDEEKVLRISLQYLSFESNVRETVGNAIGRHLLSIARQGRFRHGAHCLVIVDEAHQFLAKTVQSEGLLYSLDSFGLIAKEGRKYWLNICLATQRPRDIPDDVLSQIGFFIVHKLTNPRDRELVEKAAGDLDRRTAVEVPMLSQGQAIVVGGSLPFPLRVKIDVPAVPPESDTSPIDQSWLDQN